MIFRKKNHNKSQSEIKKILRDYAEALIIALLFALFVREYVLTAYRIPTASMVPALKVGDFIFSVQYPYNVKWPFTESRIIDAPMPKRGEVVVFNCPDNKANHCIKRVIAVAGDQVRVQNNKVDINGEPMEYKELGTELIKELPGHEYYSVYQESLGGMQHNVLLSQSLTEDKMASEFDFKVPEGFFYVLGDNRQSSDDSRLWGAIPVDDLQGRAWLIWLSLDWFNTWAGGRFPSVRWQRSFKLVHDTQDHN